MIEAKRTSTEKLKKAYDHRAKLYDRTVAISEFGYHLVALNKVDWNENIKALEIATGPGRVLLEIAKRIGRNTTVNGFDLSERMLRITQKRMLDNGFSKFILKQGDCRHLPYKDNSFDVLYNGYMMDLIPFDEMEVILREMYRVLKPGGTLIMVNMSKQENKFSWIEKLYQFLPNILVLHLMGNCRPVLMEKSVTHAKFTDVKREYLGGKHPSEIVIAKK